MQISREELKKLAKDILIDLTDEEVNKIYQASVNLCASIDVFEKLHVDQYQPMYYPFDISHHWLREDVVQTNNNPKIYIKNAKDKDDNYIILK
ncbi:MAG: hypothetical protein LBG49_02995 [Mycoplasmataceae bacterium]|nr:hypothetical protein [Mycoplasmataceae bacterium]